MDETTGWILLTAPILIVMVGYVLAWRGKSAKLRKAGNLMVAAISGLVGLFGVWWASGMTYGIFSSAHKGSAFQTLGEVLLSFVVAAVIFLFPAGACYISFQFARAAFGKVQSISGPKL